MPDGRACRPEISCPQPSPDGWLGVLYCFRLPVELGWLRSGDTIKIRILGIVVLGAALSGCAFQRAQIAQDAQANMIGMPKEQVLACMGPPVNKATEGKTEVWAYSTSPTINLDRGSGATRFCSINVTVSGGTVSAVNYQGPTGGLLSHGEQCADAVDRCSKPHS
jgi:hypothetical protein